ncbi:hypothetical protein PILCRDRAFT_8817 [Piloderma croceum F 1598]|uniref:Uncharacterized protein n=1 Tax=Piloderma croceum (strain F 1598) TaxID=765440 RepID=A0A0C3FQM9_PILCF|nr:hypothetical protein PILCRDRAFT_8817 [Piloderma croceum F 1598]
MSFLLLDTTPSVPLHLLYTQATEVLREGMTLPCYIFHSNSESRLDRDFFADEWGTSPEHHNRLTSCTLPSTSRIVKFIFRVSVGVQSLPGPNVYTPNQAATPVFKFRIGIDVGPRAVDHLAGPAIHDGRAGTDVGIVDAKRKEDAHL